MADKSEPRSFTIILWGILTSVAIFIVSVVILVWFESVTRKYSEINQAQAPTNQLNNLRNYEIETLENYSINPDTGQVRIPISRAMQLEAESAWRPDTPRPTPTPMPASQTAAPEESSTSDDDTATNEQ